MIDKIDDLTQFTPEELPTLKKILEQLYGEAVGVINTAVKPTSSTVPSGKIVLFDDGTAATRAIYIRTGKESIINTGGVGFIIENRTSDPTSPVTGQIWFRTDL